MKFETGDAAQYEQLEAPGTLAERLRHIRLLAENNWNVSSGFIAGLPGQTPRDLLKNFEAGAFAAVERLQRQPVHSRRGHAAGEKSDGEFRLDF